MIIDGYRIPGTDMEEVEKILDGVSLKMQKKAEKLYAALFCRDLAYVFDRYTIKKAQDPDSPEGPGDVMQRAKDIFFEKVRNAAGHDLPGPYSFMAGAYIYPFQGDTYLEVRLGNRDYAGCFKGIEPFGLSEEEAGNPSGKKCRIWNGIRQKYSREGKTAIFFQLLSEPVFKKEYAKFKRPAERAAELAAQDVLESCFSKLTDGKELAPAVFMSFFESAAEIAALDSVREETKRVQGELEKILADPAGLLEEKKEEEEDED